MQFCRSEFLNTPTKAQLLNDSVSRTRAFLFAFILYWFYSPAVSNTYVWLLAHTDRSSAPACLTGRDAPPLALLQGQVPAARKHAIIHRLQQHQAIARARTIVDYTSSTHSVQQSGPKTSRLYRFIQKPVRSHTKQTLVDSKYIVFFIELFVHL